MGEAVRDPETPAGIHRTGQAHSGALPAPAGRRPAPSRLWHRPGGRSVSTHSRQGSAPPCLRPLGSTCAGARILRAGRSGSGLVLGDGPFRMDTRLPGCGTIGAKSTRSGVDTRAVSDTVCVGRGRRQPLNCRRPTARPGRRVRPSRCRPSVVRHDGGDEDAALQPQAGIVAGSVDPACLVGTTTPARPPKATELPPSTTCARR